MTRFATFLLSPRSDTTHFGILIQNDTIVVDLTNVTEHRTLLQVLQSSDPSILSRLVSTVNEGSQPQYPTQNVTLCSPILAPGKVLCVGMNYREHCFEQNFPIPTEPVIFNKFASSVTGPNNNVFYDGTLTQQMDFEVELAVVIGKGGRDIACDEAMRHVAGVTVAHDVSARDWQFERNGGQWLLGKCQDTFCPLGPALVTLDEIPDVNNLRVTCRLNGETVQDSNTSEFIFDIPAILSWISQFVTLSPGDVILTGTPSGVGCFRKPPLWLKHGDVVECEIEQVGTIRNLMVDKSVASTTSVHVLSNSATTSATTSDMDGMDGTDGMQLADGVVPLWIGTYTENKGFVDGQGKGVYPCSLNTETGELCLNGSPLPTSNPTWVCTSRDGTMLYSISEDDKLNAGQRSGSVRAWDIYGKYYGGSSSGVRTSSYATGGMDTCYIELNQDETHAFVSNYTSGSIAMFGVRPDRSLGPICSFVQHTKNGGTNNTRSCGRSPRWPTCSPSKVLRKGMLPLRS